MHTNTHTRLRDINKRTYVNNSYSGCPSILIELVQFSIFFLSFPNSRNSFQKLVWLKFCFPPLHLLFLIQYLCVSVFTKYIFACWITVLFVYFVLLFDICLNVCVSASSCLFLEDVLILFIEFRFLIKSCSRWP